MLRSLAAAVLALPILSGCALTPEPCTSEWFDWKTGRILGDFAYDNRREIDDLRGIAATLFDPQTGRPAAAPSALAAISAVALAVAFSRDAWPEITDAVAECSAPPMASRLFADMLRREGFDDRTVRLIEELGGLMDLIGRRV